MNITEIREIVYFAIVNYLTAMGIDNVDVSDETELIGIDTQVDSFGLVNIIVDIEKKLADKGKPMSLTSDNAMSFSKSPFRTIGTLINYIDAQ